MKGIEGTTPEPVRPPDVNILEGSNKTRERHFSVISDDKIHSPEDVSKIEHNDDLGEASKAIVGNRELERLVIKGFLSNGNVMPYAELTNRITEICVSLNDSEIDSVIEKFKKTLRSRAVEYASEFELTGKQLENLQTGKWGDRDPKSALNPNGIKAVAHFVRARKKLHAVSPQTFPAFYFENYLDAQHKIDLIEVIEAGDGVVINLIQIKSFEYGPGDIEANTKSHKDWANEFTTDLESYEKNFSIEPEDSERYKEFFAKVDAVNDVLLDVLTGTTEPDKGLLYEKLGIGTLPNVEKIWILDHYLSELRNDFDKMVSEGLIDEENVQKMFVIINDLEMQLEKAQNHRKNLMGVSEIHSICTISEKVVSDVVIFKTDKPENRKAIKIKK